MRNNGEKKGSIYSISEDKNSSRVEEEELMILMK
jgi:hypothetical protein